MIHACGLTLRFHLLRNGFHDIYYLKAATIWFQWTDLKLFFSHDTRLVIQKAILTSTDETLGYGIIA